MTMKSDCQMSAPLARKQNKKKGQNFKLHNTIKDGNDEWEFSILCPLTNIYVETLAQNGFCRASKTLDTRYVVLYEAGYELTEDLPLGLQQIVAQIVASLYQGSLKDGSLKSEKVGDYSYTLNTEMLTNYIQMYSSALSHYKNISV